ncbi:MAG TPA: hypothetical protein VNI01_11695, partial [Elusimicrobiota bacterium]|nr:hypothetical protein [Elusimicrobiota bacterium]
TVAEAGKGMYRVCADFKTAKGGSADVDFLVRGSSDGWDVKRAILHSVDGQERAAAAAAPAPAARGEFKKVNLPGYSDKQQQGMPPGAAAAAGQMPVQMPQLPPGVSIPGMGGQQQPQGNQQ